jgi:hypothetical protein
VAVAFCEFVPPLNPGPDQVYVNADGPPFNATVVVEQVIEFGDVAVGFGNAVLEPTDVTAVLVQPLAPVTANV